MISLTTLILILSGFGILVTGLFFSFMLIPAAAMSATLLIANRTEALAYINNTFHESGCRMSRSVFFAQMEHDSVAPTVDDMSLPMDGSLKIIRQRRVLSTLEILFKSSEVCEGMTDKTIAISKFGGCA